MALTSLWKMLCCSTWLSTRGRSVPKPWLLSLSWRVGGETPERRCGLGADFGIPHRSLGFWPQLGECLFPNFFWSKWWQVSVWATADAHGLNLTVTCGTLVTVFMLQVDTLLTVDVPQRYPDVAATSFAMEEMSFSSLAP